jgi:hypothetical protein
VPDCKGATRVRRGLWLSYRASRGGLMGASVSQRGALCKRSSKRKRADEGHTEEEEEAPATEGDRGVGQPGASIIRAPREMGASEERVAASSDRSHCPLVQLAHGSQTLEAWVGRHDLI